MKVQKGIIIDKMKVIGLLLMANLIAFANPNGMSERIKAAESEPAKFDELITEINKLSNTPEYFIFQDELGAAMVPLAKSDPSLKLKLNSQLETALSKPCPSSTPDVTAKMFEAKGNIAARLADVSPQERNIRHAKILAEFVGEVRASMIPDYKHVRVTANVSPPINSGEPMVTGMNPKAIKDPKARAAYEAAIAENKLKNQKNQLYGVVLPQVSRVSAMILVGYCKQLFASQPQEKQHLGVLAKAAHLTEKEEEALAGR